MNYKKLSLLLVSLLVACGNGQESASNSLTPVSEELPISTPSSEPMSTIDEEIQEMKNTLLALLNNYEESQYLPSVWLEMKNLVKQSVKDVENCQTLDDLNALLTNTTNALANKEKYNVEYVEHPFQETASDVYRICPSADGQSVEIGYSTWPGDFAYVGNYPEYALTELEVYNSFHLKLENLGENRANVMVKLFADLEATDLVGGGEVFFLDPNQTIEKDFALTGVVKKVMVFVDSNYDEENLPRHNHEGIIKLSNYYFEYIAPEYAKYWVASDPNVYHVEDKADVLANITYENISANTWTRISYDLINEYHQDEILVLKVRNNSDHAIRIVMHAGTYVDDGTGNYVFSAAYNLYSYEDNGETKYGDGEQYELPSGEEYEFLIKSDNGVAITQIYFELDSCYWEDDQKDVLRTGDIDVVSLTVAPRGE